MGVVVGWSLSLMCEVGGTMRTTAGVYKIKTPNLMSHSTGKRVKLSHLKSKERNN